jgi:hypothetical protein
VGNLGDHWLRHEERTRHGRKQFHTLGVTAVGGVQERQNRPRIYQ